MSHRAPAILLIVIALVVLQGCKAGVRLRSAVGQGLHMTAVVEEGANANSAVAVDVLLVYDAAMLPQLMQMTGADWFARRAQFQKDDPSSHRLEVWHWEWVPGQPAARYRLPLRARARAGMVFAQMQAAGTHRSSFDPHRPFTLTIRATAFTLTPGS